MKGWFITLEGPEGAGKSTQIARLRDYLLRRGIPVVLTREPGGTAVGDRIREILLDPRVSEMALSTEVLLYAASRAQLVEEVIRPSLNEAKTVLCDRYVDSSIVYQAFGGNAKRNEVVEVNRMATGGLMPDRTYLLDLSPEEGDKRLKGRDRRKDRMELKGKEFHRKVREGFIRLAEEEPERFCLVNAALSPDEVSDYIIRDLENHIFKSRGREDHKG
ncbi:dTMP kinase [Melghirimyces profundicolus]|uniref:Thymidylate kinase n=1 Tax=Melghirimyces profundicolus TaxID=1242148 RepID=A0A2T6BGP5_9BACL|nr:dTMP kinase [Melghirimyces profundicolus]PTX55211.1 dTMP kinase [Melghirimyces profundicolus]